MGGFCSAEVSKMGTISVFKREEFIHSTDLGDEKNHHTSKRWLKTDDLGVNVFQSVHTKSTVDRLVLRGSERNTVFTRVLVDPVYKSTPNF